MSSQKPDTKKGFYYVSARKDNGDTRLLSGPYVNDHAAALADVDAYTKMALDKDPKAHWYSYGTMRSDTPILGKCVFNNIEICSNPDIIDAGSTIGYGSVDYGAMDSTESAHATEVSLERGFV